MSNITYQPKLRPALPRVFGPKDYHDFRDKLKTIDDLVDTGAVQKGPGRISK